MADHSRLVEDEQALLFVYGTLLRGFENAAFLSSSDKAAFLCEGVITGALYDVGPFPAVLPPQPNGHVYKIKGELYQINDPLVLFETLDLVEGYNHRYPQGSLFVREKTMAETVHGPKEVWAYFYNQPLENAVLIESGDYREYLASRL